MEDRGIAIDPKMLGSFEKVLGEELGKIDLPLNPFSNPQIQSYVYGELGIEPWKFTEAGAPRVDEDVLETIDDPVVKTILAYKSLYKEKDTYADNYTKGMTLDGRIHTQFKQCRTSTARLSSSKPNLQNVPKEGNMRKLFIAGKGKKLILADAKQIELICNAIIAPEPHMLDLYRKLIAGEDVDIHRDTSEALHKDRDFAKHLNFMMQNCRDIRDAAWKLSMELKLPINEATEFVKAYYKQYPGLLAYKQRIIEESKLTKRVTNRFGRTLRIDALYAEDWRIRREGEREAICFPVQSLAGEVIKLAMIDLHYKHAAPMLLQEHDALMFEVDEKDALEYAHWLKDYLPTITEIDGIHFPYDVGMGDSWWECKQKENEIK